MSNTQEKSADIIAEMRELAKSVNFRVKPLPYTMYGKLVDIYFAELADRLEAALKREKTEIEAEALAAGGIAEAERNKPGNAAALREALSDACYAMFNFLKAQNGGYEEMAKALDKAKAALAAPSRNCDVGTPEEQTNRFMTYCNSRVCKRRVCSSCGYEELFRHKCFAIWSQMPYEEGGVK